MENRKRNVQIIIRVTEEERAQLQKIGVNVNQIAKRINETGRIYADDMDEMKRVMEEVWRLERRLLLQFKGLTK